MQLSDKYPLYLAGKPVQTNADLAVTNKYTGEIATRVASADTDTVNAAIAAAVEAQKVMNKMPSYERKKILEEIVAALKARHEEFSYVLAIEAGKPIKDARGEITRAIDTFTVAAEEATRIYGEYLPLDISERAAGTQGIVRRFPNGPIAMVSPFNFPMNLAAHKIAPAIAAGCAFVLKPASYTPVSALLLGEVLSKTTLPEGAFSILPCTRAAGNLLVTDDRLKVFSFTGSPTIGYKLMSQAGKKKCVLELGGNAACIVDQDADVEHVTDRLIFGAFYQSGQSCISVQRIYVHETIYERVKASLVKKASALKSGDPLDESVFIGPIISEGDAIRMEQWINQAVDLGGRILVGGVREGVMLQATILENVPRTANVMCDEVFGPVCVIAPFTDFKAVVEEVNDSVFGLQAGVFTNNMNHSFYAFENLEVGGVVINDVPSVRVDSQPYGGVKDSGLGREGLRYAIEDFTEQRIMLLRSVGRL